MDIKPNILDRALAYVAPRAALRRLNARATMAKLGYNAASNGRRTAHWKSSGASANAVISQDLPTLRDRSRDLFRNSPLAKKAVKAIVTRVIGTGIAPKPRTPNESVNEIISADFAIWARQTGYWQNQELLFQGMLVGGESLYRKRIRRKTDTDRFGVRLRVPLELQLMQSEFIDHNKTQNTDTGYIINGVEFDGLGKRVAYWLFDAHPGDNVNTAAWRGKGGLTSNRIPASEIEHGFIADEEGQVRGVPHASSVLLLHRDLEDTADADLMRRKSAACFGVAFESPENPDVQVGNQSTDGNGDTLEELGPGMILRPKAGEKISLITPPDAPGLIDFMRMEERQIAAGYNIPYEELTGDYSQGNYSSSRMGFIGYRDWLTKIQWNVAIPFICDPVYVKFIDLMGLLGRIPMSMIEDGTAYIREWGPPKIDVLDRESEAAATRMQMEDGTVAWSQAVMAEGNDPIEQIELIKGDEDMWRSRGMEPPWLRDKVMAAPVAATKKEPNGKTKSNAA